MRTIFTAEAPAPAGHYSQAVETGGFVFVSGTLPSTRPPEGPPPGFEDQARAVVPVPELHHGYLIEVQMTAALPGR